MSRRKKQKGSAAGAVVLLIILLFVFGSCGGSDEEEEQAATTTQTTTEQEDTHISFNGEIVSSDWFYIQFDKFEIVDDDTLRLYTTFEDRGMTSSEVSDLFRVYDLSLRGYFIVSQGDWEQYDSIKFHDQLELARAKMNDEEWEEDLEVPMHERIKLCLEYKDLDRTEDVIIYATRYDTVVSHTYSVEGDILVLKD